MDASAARHGIELPDRQLACAPIGAARAAATWARWPPRPTSRGRTAHAIAHSVREAIARCWAPRPPTRTRQVYDVAHNVAKLERYGGRELCVHRKGATRAFPPGHRRDPGRVPDAGQPVFIPGSMGTSSFVLAGRDGSMQRSFGTTCHGAGRRMSRTRARKQIEGAELRRQLEADGITVRCPSNRGLAEEAPFAYKDVEAVVDVVERAGLAARVAQLRPIGVVKG